MVRTHGCCLPAEDIEAIRDRTVVITGGNAGVGFVVVPFRATSC